MRPLWRDPSLLIIVVLAPCLWLLWSLCSPVFGQGLCPPGQVCPTCPTPSQAWRVSRPVATQAVAGSANNPAIVRIACLENTGWGYGTGTIFERRGKIAHVLTAAHVVLGSRRVSVRVRNVWHGATIKHVDRDWDVAILSIADPGVTPLPLADNKPGPGESIELSGFGSGSYSYQVGRLTQFVGPGRGLPFEWMEVSAPTRVGDSGGPMVNSHGRLVGVISGGGRGRTVGCCFPRIRAIVRGVLPPYPRRPGVIVPKPIVVMPTSPPPPVMPLPVTPLPLIDYDKLAEAILKRIDLADLRGPAGPQGPQGPPGNDGLTGLTGSAGPTPAIDLDALAQAVIERLPPQQVEWETLDGTILSQEKPLGEPLRFKSVEIDARK